MTFFTKLNSIMFKIFQIMDKINKFLIQMAGDNLPQENRKKQKPKKSKTKKQKPKKSKTKKQKKTIPKQEFHGGFDFRGIGDRMLQKNDRSIGGYGE